MTQLPEISGKKRYQFLTHMTCNLRDLSSPPGGGVITPSAFYVTPPNMYTAKGVISGCKPKLHYYTYNRQETAMNQYTVSMTVTNL